MNTYINVPLQPRTHGNDENIYDEINDEVNDEINDEYYISPEEITYLPPSNETNNHEQGHLAELNCEFIIQKIRKRKWWILLIIVLLVLIVGLAVGLSVSSPPTMATSTDGDNSYDSRFNGPRHNNNGISRANRERGTYAK